MKKRILTLMLIAVMTVMLIPSAHASWTMYVSPAAGTTVNLRSTPDASKNANNLITQIPYGTALTVKYISGGWACIDYGVGAYDEGFMMSKYLTDTYRAPTAANMKKKTSGSSRSSGSRSSGSAASGDLATQFSNMNKQFHTFRKVDRQFIVYGKPERATGWVNFRFAPNEKAELVRRLRQNEQLTVIGETDRWYQVEDPETGIIGYVSRFYVSANQN